jgi:CRISPR/Cas system CSM-associated protein Csm3 (group 7 of RAMP superfamily)
MVAVTRDEAGRPVLPGTSLAGVLRKRTRELLGEAVAIELFGADTDADDPSPSALVVDDATLVAGTTSSETGTSSRTAIDRDRASAAPGLLFTDEIVPAGAEFRLRMHLVDPNDITRAHLRALLRSLADEHLTIGSTTRSGRGRLALGEVEIRDVDLAAPSTLMAFLLATFEDRDSIGDEATLDGVEATAVFEPTPRLRITASFDLAQPLLAAPVTGTDNEGRQNTAVHTALLGTAIRGAMRTRAERIQRTATRRETWNAALQRSFAAAAPKPNDVASRLFGSTERAGSLVVEDSTLSGSTTVEVPSTPIDRWTGGAASGGLHMSIAAYGGELTLTWELDGPSSDEDVERLEELGLFVLVLLDLATGDLPLGARTNRGFGELDLTRLAVEARGPVHGLGYEAPTRSWHKVVRSEVVRSEYGPGGRKTRATVVQLLPTPLVELFELAVSAFAATEVAA